MVSASPFSLPWKMYRLRNSVDLISGPSMHGRGISWIKRLEIAEDAAKGLFSRLN